MSNKKVILSYEGSSEQIDFAISQLAFRAGWKQLTQSELDAGQVQQTKESAALDFVTNFIREAVKLETLKQIEAEIARQAAETRALATAQTKGGLDLITKGLEVIEVE